MLYQTCKTLIRCNQRQVLRNVNSSSQTAPCLLNEMQVLKKSCWKIKLVDDISCDRTLREDFQEIG